MRYRHFSSLLLAIVVCALAGCPKPQAAGEGEEDESSKVRGAVTAFSDSARTPEAFPDAWVGGNAPDEKIRKQFQKFYQNQDLLTDIQEPKIDGNQAIVDISITSYDDVDTVIETITWKLEKEGEEWKISDAPLPTTPF